MKSILVVDDDPAVAEALAIYLTAEGYRTQIAGNGQEALATIDDEFVPDLVITDIFMPVMDGQTLKRTMKNDPRLCDVPVLLITGAPAFAREAPLEETIVLHKPIGLQALLGVIEQMIGRAADP